MKCERAKEAMMDYLDGKFDELEIIRMHTSTCPDCAREFEEIKNLEPRLVQLPIVEPGPSLRAGFYQMLEKEKAELSSGKAARSSWFEKFFLNLKPVSLALPVITLLLGWIIGMYMGPKGTDNKELTELTVQLQQTREMMLLTLIQQPSPSERMKAVSLTGELDKVDNKVINALLTTLNNDENVNVRLVTVETLVTLAYNPVVRKGLIQSLVKQDNPLVQNALIDALLFLQEKQAVPQLKDLLKDKGLNDAIRKKAEKSIDFLS
jgi:HEAT repeat protein